MSIRSQIRVLRMSVASNDDFMLQKYFEEPETLGNVDNYISGLGPVYSQDGLKGANHTTSKMATDTL
jgi:hypothetical protein